MTDRLLRVQSKAKAKSYVRTRVPSMPSRHFLRHYFLSYVRDPFRKDLSNIDDTTIDKLMASIDEDIADPDREAKLGLLKGIVNCFHASPLL